MFTLYIKAEYRLELAYKDSSLVGHYLIKGTKQGKNLGLKDLSKCQRVDSLIIRNILSYLRILVNNN